MSTTWRWGKKKSDEIRERIGSLQPSQPTATQSQSDFQLSDKHKQELLDIVEGRDTFSYDAQSDPMYQQYREQYRRNARGAAEDVYANATARSGGFGNSYANVAAQQTYNAQMEGVTDIIPELEALAYGRHQAQQEQKLTAYDQLQALYDADHEELLSRMYLYAYNGTQEGLWDGASGAKEALRAKFPEMTDDDFATIKAEMYDGGYWKGAEKSGAPSGGYTAEDGTVVSEERINEAYNFLLGLMQGTEDTEGIDVMARKSYVAQLAEDSGFTAGELEGAYAKLDKYEQANTVDEENIYVKKVTDALDAIRNGYSVNPTDFGIDAEEWEKMPDEKRKRSILDWAESMAKSGQVGSGLIFRRVAYESTMSDLDKIIKNGDSFSEVSSLIEYIDGCQEEGLMNRDGKVAILVEMAKKMDESGYLSLEKIGELQRRYASESAEWVSFDLDEVYDQYITAIRMAYYAGYDLEKLVGQSQLILVGQDLVKKDGLSKNPFVKAKD